MQYYIKQNGTRPKNLQSWLHQSVKLFAICFVTIALLGFLCMPTGVEAAENNTSITVYRDPGCRCCGGWIDHLSAQGLQSENIPTSEMDALKQRYGIPENLTSCHTAIIDGYVVEGHVPIADIKRLIAEQPDVVGITVPGMPIGTPGMESGDERESFTVFSFDRQGNTEVFNQYAF